MAEASTVILGMSMSEIALLTTTCRSPRFQYMSMISKVCSPFI
jgi:hypothetical protein